MRKALKERGYAAERRTERHLRGGQRWRSGEAAYGGGLRCVSTGQSGQIVLLGNLIILYTKAIIT